MSAPKFTPGTFTEAQLRAIAALWDASEGFADDARERAWMALSREERERITLDENAEEPPGKLNEALTLMGEAFPAGHVLRDMEQFPDTDPEAQP